MPKPKHFCHWPSCEREVHPSLWGCKTHWFLLPKTLRDKIWATYRPGQEITKTPSPEYIAAAREVMDWITKGQEIADLLDQSNKAAMKDMKWRQ